MEDNVIRRHKKDLCGQRCIAHILQKPIWEITNKAGQAFLPGKKIVEILKYFGRHEISPLTRYKKSNYDPIPSHSLVRIINPYTKMVHWVVKEDGVVYDPNKGRVGLQDWLKQIQAEDFKISSYLTYGAW